MSRFFLNVMMEKKVTVFSVFVGFFVTKVQDLLFVIWVKYHIITQREVKIYHTLVKEIKLEHYNL